MSELTKRLDPTNTSPFWRKVLIVAGTLASATGAILVAHNSGQIDLPDNWVQGLNIFGIVAAVVTGKAWTTKK